MSYGLYPLFNKGLNDNIGLEFMWWKPKWKEIFKVYNTNFRYEDDQEWEGYQYPGFRIPGQSVAAGQFLPSFNKRYVIRNFGLLDSVAQEDLDDDLYGVINRVIPSKAGLMARAFQDQLETDNANMFAVSGFASGTVQGSPDGKSLFNTAHLTSASQSTVTWANRPSIEADLSISSFQAAQTNLRTQKAPNNVSFINNPARVLVVNPGLEYVAKQILKGTWIGNSADLTQNWIAADDNVMPIFWPYFQKSGATGTNNAWFVVGQDHWLKFFMRQKPTSRSDYDINTNSQIFTVLMRYDKGWSSARGTYGSTGI